MNTVVQYMNKIRIQNTLHLSGSSAFGRYFSEAQWQSVQAVWGL